MISCYGKLEEGGRVTTREGADDVLDRTYYGIAGQRQGERGGNKGEANYSGMLYA